jgi:hypothetical protein
MGKQPFLPRGDIYDLKAQALMALADLLGEDAADPQGWQGFDEALAQGRLAGAWRPSDRQLHKYFLNSSSDMPICFKMAR